MVYVPSRELTAVRLKLVFLSVAVTVTPGTTAALGSVTVPVKLPWACCARTDIPPAAISTINSELHRSAMSGPSHSESPGLAATPASRISVQTATAFTPEARW